MKRRRLPLTIVPGKRRRVVKHALAFRPHRIIAQIPCMGIAFQTFGSALGTVYVEHVALAAGKPGHETRPHSTIHLIQSGPFLRDPLATRILAVLPEQIDLLGQRRPHLDGGSTPGGQQIGPHRRLIVDIVQRKLFRRLYERYRHDRIHSHLPINDSQRVEFMGSTVVKLAETPWNAGTKISEADPSVDRS